MRVTLKDTLLARPRFARCGTTDPRMQTANFLRRLASVDLIAPRTPAGGRRRASSAV